MIQSSEFRIEMKSSEEECSRISFHQIEECKDEEDDQENLIDENEELVQSADLRSYEQVGCSQTFRSGMSSVTPISMIDLSASMNSQRAGFDQKQINNSGGDLGEEWMYKTFSNSKQLSFISGSKKSPSQQPNIPKPPDLS